MKKVILVMLSGMLLLGLSGCGAKKETPTPDAIQFKEEYESLNGVSNSSGSEYRTVSIPTKNPFTYITTEELIEKFDNEGTFYVYFGYSYCPWCRSVIEKATAVAKANHIDTIYYIDVWDGDHIENLRDTYKIHDASELELVSEGAQDYYILLAYLDNVLGEYILTNADGEKIFVGEKRIFLPNFIYVEDGKAIKLEEGISEKQANSRMELTDEILKDEETKFNIFFKSK